MGAAASCQHRDTEVIDVNNAIYIETSNFGDRQLQLAVESCVKCASYKRKLVRYKQLSGGWGRWSAVDVSNCQHPDSCLAHHTVRTAKTRLIRRRVTWSSSANTEGRKSSVDSDSKINVASSDTTRTTVKCQMCDKVFEAVIPVKQSRNSLVLSHYSTSNSSMTTHNDYGW